MPVPNGECQTKNERNHEKDDDEKPIRALDEGTYFMLKIDIPILFVYTHEQGTLLFLKHMVLDLIM